MVATALTSVRAPLANRKAFTVASKSTRVAARVAPRVECSAQKKAEQVMAGVTVSLAAVMTNPLVAEAAVTPSLKNLINSVVAGGAVLGLIFGAVSAVASFDRIKRS